MDELYVVARSVLLDALEALGAHRDAIVVVGAQAVYLRAGEGDLVVAPYTTDGDLALDPSLLAEIPPIGEALMRADFIPGGRDAVGVWLMRREVASAPEVQTADARNEAFRRKEHLPTHYDLLYTVSRRGAVAP